MYTHAGLDVPPAGGGGPVWPSRRSRAGACGARAARARRHVEKTPLIPPPRASPPEFLKCIDVYTVKKLWGRRAQPPKNILIALGSASSARPSQSSLVDRGSQLSAAAGWMAGSVSSQSVASVTWPAGGDTYDEAALWIAVAIGIGVGVDVDGVAGVVVDLAVAVVVERVANFFGIRMDDGMAVVAVHGSGVAIPDVVGLGGGDRHVSAQAAGGQGEKEDFVHAGLPWTLAKCGSSTFVNAGRSIHARSCGDGRGARCGVWRKLCFSPLQRLLLGAFELYRCLYTSKARGAPSLSAPTRSECCWLAGRSRRRGVPSAPGRRAMGSRRQ